MKNIQKSRYILKKVLSPLARLVMAIIPASCLGSIVAYYPRILPYIPAGRKLIYKNFLGDISVYINTVYPIEKQMLTGSYDKGAISLFKKYIKKGDVCFDVGANVGPLSFAMAKIVTERGQVYAFEPGTIIYQRLVDNLERNPAYKQIIRPVKQAFGDEEKVMYWNEDVLNRGNGGFVMQAPNQQEKIKLITLDSFVRANSINRINFIKIDVEGMEYDVIKGGMKSIEKYKPILFYETGFFEKGFWAEIARQEKVVLKTEDLLRSAGYVIYKIENNQIRETQYPDLSYNTLAIHKSFS